MVTQSPPGKCRCCKKEFGLGCIMTQSNFSPCHLLGCEWKNILKTKTVKCHLKCQWSWLSRSGIHRCCFPGLCYCCALWGYLHYLEVVKGLRARSGIVTVRPAPSCCDDVSCIRSSPLLHCHSYCCAETSITATMCFFSSLDRFDFFCHLFIFMSTPGTVAGWFIRMSYRC